MTPRQQDRRAQGLIVLISLGSLLFYGGLIAVIERLWV